MMTRNTSLLAALLLGAAIGGSTVWWTLREESADESVPREEAAGSNAEGRAHVKGPMAGISSSASAPVLVPEPSTLAAGPSAEKIASPGESPSSAKDVIVSPADQRAEMRRKELPGQATIVDQVVIPVPSEIFAALEKVGRPRWKQVLRSFNAPVRPRSGAEETALLLGNVIAEGFIAVEAENAAQVKRVGQSVLNLSVAIGVRKTVMMRSNAILEGADRRDWPRVRNELDRALADVKSAMGELNSETLADLVSLGGWLRGAEALATVVDDDFAPDAAELLHQPALVEHFSERLRNLSARARSLEIILALEQGLQEIQPHIVPDRPIKEAQVKEILKITSRLTKRIEGKKGR